MPKPAYTKNRNRVPITLSEEAMASYSKFADLVGLPLPTLLRQNLEQGVPYINNMILALEDDNPQKGLLLAKGIQAEVISNLGPRKD